ASAYNSLGSLRFLSLVKICDAIVGNSSSGIIEAPSLHTATINIGGRQKGRAQADSILNCEVDENSISTCFNKVKEDSFRQLVKNVDNSYGAGGTSNRIMKLISNLDFKQLTKKTLY